MYIDSDLDDRQLFQEALKEIDPTIDVVCIDHSRDIASEIKGMTRKPDLVIVAINRPSEIELTHLERCLEDTGISTLPFCVLSSTTVNSIVNRAYELGIKSFLVKPDNFRVLKSLLKSALSHNWSDELQLERDQFVVTEGVVANAFRCFMVDDDREDRDILLHALQEIYPSLPFDTAFDGESAIERLMDGMPVPDVIFLDLNMPRMNGLECLRVMRTMRSLDRCKIVILTVSTDPLDMERTLALGANHYIVKPENHSSLVNALNEVLA